MQLIDTHAHLYLKDFKEDFDEVISRCRENDIIEVLLPNIDCSTISDLDQISNQYPDLFRPMMGLHPCSVKEDFEEELNRVTDKLNTGQYIAVGEIGLDYYWDTTFKNEQQKALEYQINLAKELNLPVAIHCRESFSDIIAIVRKLKDDNLAGVFHCFTGNYEEAQQVIELGFYLGIGGVLTFRNSGLDKIIERVDIQHLILETDSPYLTPVPYRGKRNESSYTKFIAHKLAEIKKISVEETASQTTANAKKLFKL